MPTNDTVAASAYKTKLSEYFENAMVKIIIIKIIIVGSTIVRLI